MNHAAEDEEDIFLIQYSYFESTRSPQKESLVYYTVDLEILHQVVLWRILSNNSWFFLKRHG